MSSTLTSRQQRRWFWASLAVTLAVAALFRLWELQSIPPGLFGDEAADGIDALDVLAGRGQVFFPANYGREGLHMWIVALAIQLLGATPMAIRLPSVLAGILVAPVTLWLGWELYVLRPGQRQTPDSQPPYLYLIPLAAALYVATSYWHIHFSRFGIRGVFTTTLTALTMAALWRGINQRHWSWFVLSGLFLGLGLHFYTASRFVPIVLALFLGSWILLSRLRKGRPLRREKAAPPLAWVLILFLAAGLVFAPLAAYFVSNPGSFTQRAGEVFAFQDGAGQSELAVIGRAAAANLLQFVVPGRGDEATFYNLPGRAVFDPLTALLALLGLVICLKRWRSPPYSFLLLWLVVMVAPSFVAVDRFPTLPRVLGVIPGIFFLPALGLGFLISWVGSKWVDIRTRAGRSRPSTSTYSERTGSRPASGPESLSWVGTAGVILLTMAVAVHGGLSYYDYFHRWGRSPATAEAFESDMTALWRWHQAHPEIREVFLSSDLYRHPTFMFLHEQTPTTEYFTRSNPNLHWFDGRKAWPIVENSASQVVLASSAALPPPFIVDQLRLVLEPIEEGAAYRGDSNVSIVGSPAIQFTDQLSLLAQGVALSAEPEQQAFLLQVWSTAGPEDAPGRRFQIQSALVAPAGQQLVQASDDMGFSSMEWDVGGVFLTWQVVPWSGSDEAVATALRLVPEGQAPLQPVGADEEGWLILPLVGTSQLLAVPGQ